MSKEIKAMASGLLVLGMHRSGTSALSRVLGLSGFDLGTRLVGPGPGNETGHWEDAFAVELHERLLAAHGAAWDDALALPAGWLQDEDGSQAVAEIEGYLSSDRARHARWSVKDPRLCLFAPAWREAAQAAGQPLAAILMLRHPMEVARSLAARDGLPTGRGLLLWLEYSLAAAEAAVALPHAVVDYSGLLADWRQALARVQALPGLDGMVPGPGAAGEITAFLDAGRRHQSAAEAALPDAVEQAWQVLQACRDSNRIDPEAIAALRRHLAPLRELMHPVLADWRATRGQLWQRVGRAEAALADEATRLPAVVQALSQGVDASRSDLVEAISGELRRMQDVVTQVHAGAAARERDAALGQELAPRLDRLESGLVPLSARLPGEVKALADGIEANRSGLIEAISGELRRMQDVVAQARAETAAREKDVALARAETGALEKEAALARELTLRLDQLAEGIEANRSSLVEAISQELRRMQGVVADARADAARHEARAAEAQRAMDRVSEHMQENLATLNAELVQALANGHSLKQSIDALEAAGQDMQARHDADCQALAEAQARHDADCQALAEAQARHDADCQALAEAQARSQQLATEVTTLRYETDQLRDIARQFDQVRKSRTWRWTRPLRALARLLRGEFAESDRARLRRAFGRKPRGFIHPGLPGASQPGGIGMQLLPDAAEAEAIAIALQAEGLEDVFVWSVIDWHFRFQRPQHLARALAQKGHRVFYISNNFNDSAEPGFHLDPLDSEGRLFQVHLNLAGKPPIYFGMPADDQVESLRASLAELLAWSCTRSSVSLVQHPYWSPLVRAVPAARVVYDCMDHHGGFENNAPAVLEAEARLVEDAELVVVTSAWLEQEIAPRARATAMVRNAGEFDFFREAPDRVFADPQGRRVIGYYGAIAEWFDLELVRHVARAHSDCLLLLVGNDTAGASEALADLPNVRLTGEVPYAELPYWLHGFDVCLLPFRVIPLTLATNPVKVYEYLAAGKPVVSVDLPEMAQFDGLVQVASDPGDFAAKVGLALADQSGDAVRSRQSFAARQTWRHRAEAFDEALACLAEPKVSVIVLTYNNLAFTEACLFSLEAYSAYRNLEVIVVDNASSDGSREWLQQWVAQDSAAGHERRLLLNEQNLGFSGGNNVGLRSATGDVLVMLNNDTYVTPGWIRGLCNHLRDEPRLGLVGPVTNNIGNEARIEIGYADMAGMIHQAGLYTRAHPGHRTPLRTAAFFCVAMRRDVYERVGDMDEEFGVGFFEDDDYCRRIEQAGLQVACADDVFVHHHLSASFDALNADRKRELFEANRAVYEKKWGPWTPHAYR